MKKLLMLVMAVAIVGTAFAETDPVFSGTFKAYFGYSLNEEAVKQSASDKATLNLNATIDEWNTVSVEFELADAMWSDDDNNVHNSAIDAVNSATNANLYDETTRNALTKLNKIEERSDYLRMKEYTLTSDILGALGVEGPVGMKIKLGSFGFGAAQVVSVAPLSTDTANGSGGTGGNPGIQFDFIFVDKVTLSTVVYPEELHDKTPEFGVSLKATELADMIDFATYFIISSYNTVDKQYDGDSDDSDGDSFGVSAAVKIGDIVKFGLGLEMNLEDYMKDEATDSAFKNTNGDAGKITANKTKVQADLSLTFGDAVIGLSYGIDGLGGEDDDFGKNSKIKASATYKFSDKFSIFGGIGLADFSGDDKLTERFLYDAGIMAKLGDNLDIQIGGSHKMDFKASEDDFQNVLYVQFSTSF